MGTYEFDANAGEPVSFEEKTINDFFRQQLAGFGLEVAGPHVRMENGVVTVRGEAADQPTREKIVLALGNLKGVRQVRDEMTVAGDAEVQEAPEPSFYTVKKGDTLSKIARAYYGDPMKYVDIYQANRPLLVDPNRIFPGQVLRIPPKAEA